MYVLYLGLDQRSYFTLGTWMGDRQRAGKPSQYATVTQVNSA